MPHFSRIGEPFITLSEVDSTNNYAMARIGEMPVSEGTTWFAWKQTSGKGQRGNQWQSEPGENITLSIVLKPVMLSPGEQFMLSAAVALGTRDLVKSYTGSDIKIKWSNDIYWNDKKTGGILIENVIRGSLWHYAVVGVGLNVNQESFPSALPNPVSLRQITGRRYDVLEVSRELCQCIGRWYAALQSRNFNHILTEYTGSLYRLGQLHEYQMGKDRFKASIQGVKQDGKLLLLKGNNLLEADFGEVAFIL
jgi:BirA family biotin operon repressor/biotin-[acetyl-CoA-carboxylase] ligase